jgi:hypothetical protein
VLIRIWIVEAHCDLRWGPVDDRVRAARSRADSTALDLVVEGEATKVRDEATLPCDP